MENPKRSSAEVIEYLIKALNGTPVIRWSTRQNLVTGQQEVKVT